MIDGQLQLAALIDQTFGLAVILSLKRNSPQRTILLHKFSQMHASSERFFFQAIANKIIKPACPKEAPPERPLSARNARGGSLRDWHHRPAIGANSCRSDLRLWKAEKVRRHSGDLFICAKDLLIEATLAIFSHFTQFNVVAAATI